MGGGKTSSNQQANGQVTFAPNMQGGGSVYIGGNIGNGDVQQGSESSASGPSASLGFTFVMPEMPGLPGGLMNLNGCPYDDPKKCYNFRFASNLQNLKATTAIVATPAQANALLAMNNQLESPY